MLDDRLLKTRCARFRVVLRPRGLGGRDGRKQVVEGRPHGSCGAADAVGAGARLRDRHRRIGGLIAPVHRTGGRRRRLHAGVRLAGVKRELCRSGAPARERAPRQAGARGARNVGAADGGGSLEGAPHGCVPLHVPRRSRTPRCPQLARPGAHVRVSTLGGLGRERRLRLPDAERGDGGVAELAGSSREHRERGLPGRRNRRGGHILGAELRDPRRLRLPASRAPGSA
jgi:hypothetical protein